MKARPLETVMDPQTIGLADVYAQGLAETLGSRAEAQTVSEELTFLAELIDQIDGAVDLLVAVTVGSDDRQALVERVFGGRVSKPVLRLLGVLGRNNRLFLLADVARQFARLLKIQAGQVEVVVRTAVTLDETTRQTLKSTLAEALAAEPVLREIVDADVIGGVVIQVGDAVYDASVAGELRRMVEKITDRALNAGQHVIGTGE